MRALALGSRRAAVISGGSTTRRRLGFMTDRGLPVRVVSYWVVRSHVVSFRPFPPPGPFRLFSSYPPPGPSRLFLSCPVRGACFGESGPPLPAAPRPRGHRGASPVPAPDRSALA